MIFCMKKLVLLLIILFSTISVYATESTEYLENLYQPKYERKLKITSKGEVIDKYDQFFNGVYIPEISYGYGYLKVKKCRKQKISYICLLDCNRKPLWGHVIPR